MKKHVLALLTALVAMLCLVTVSFAAEGDTVIDKVEIFFDEPAPGKAVPEIRVPEGAHYSVAENSWTDGGTGEKATVLDKSHYSIRIGLQADEGYSFTRSNMTVLINGEKHDNFWNNGQYIPVFYEYSFLQPISAVEIFYDTPAAGTPPQIRVPQGALYTVDSQKWYDLDAYEYVSKLSKGGRYEMVTYLVPAKGYEFAAEVEMKINGKESDRGQVSWNRVSLLANHSLCQMINDVAVSFDQPVAGQTPPAMKLPSAAPYVVESVEWYDLTNNVSNPAKLADGSSFAVSLELRPKDGYAFSDGLAATVNGAPVEPYPGYSNPTRLVIEFHFTFAEVIHVAEVSFAEPVPPCAAPKITVAADAPYTVEFAKWNDATNGVEDVSSLQVGIQYSVFVQLVPKAGYEFAKDAKILFNGQNAVNTGGNYTFLWATYTCKKPVPDVKISTKADTGKPYLTWKAIPGAVKYEVYRATSSTGSYSKMSTTANTYYTNTTAVAGETYYYKVRAVDTDGESGEFSAVKSITCDLPAPANLKISTKADTGKPTLTWDKVDGAVKYEIWRATSQNGTYYKMYTQTSTSYTNTSAEPNRQYYYKVKALASSSYADSALSEAKTVVCDCAQPVTSLTVKADSGKPYLTWKAVDGAVKYEVYRATSKNGTYTKMYTTSGTSYINSTAKPGTTYYYKVRALGSSSYATGAYSVVKSITCDCAQPVAKLSIKADSGKPYLTWEPVTGAVKYEVYRATSKNGNYTKMLTTTNTYYTNTSAQPGTTYYYKVRAIGSTEYANSAYSTVKSITCDCAAPVVTITTNSAGKPYLTWKAVDGAKEYAIYRATSANGTYEKMWTTTGTYYTNTSAKSGTTYYYKVIALGSTSYANSAYSNIVSVKCK